MADLRLTTQERNSAFFSSLWGVAALVIGVVMLTVALPSYDYVESIKLKGYASAASLEQRSRQYDQYLKSRDAWVKLKLDLYDGIVANQLRAVTTEAELYRTRSEARSFFRRRISDLAQPGADGKPFLALKQIGLEFDSLDSAFQSYCAYNKGVLCAASPEAGQRWDAMVRAQQGKQVIAMALTANKEALTTISQAEADSLLTMMQVDDADSARRLLEAIGQWKSSWFRPLFHLPLLIQYLVLAFCFGALGGYARYLAEIFARRATEVKRVGEVALGGAGAAFIVLIISAAGFGVVTAGAGSGPIATNPITVTALSLLAGVTSESILGAVQAVGRRLFGGQADPDTAQGQGQRPASPPPSPPGPTPSRRRG